MATHEIDQKLLGRLARDNAASQPYMAQAMLQILGLSIMLGPRLVMARKARIFLTTKDDDAVLLLHQIMWLCRTGLQLLEELVMPIASRPQSDARLKVFTAKLRASFYHVFCLFRNNPAVLLKPLLSPTAARAMAAARGAAQDAAANPSKQSPPSATARGGRTGLRDPIQSITSEVSYVTNPYANDGPARSPAVGPPPGISVRKPVPVPNDATFIVPIRDYIPYGTRAFNIASKLAVDLLPGSAPLRLSVVLEHCAFLWDCLQDHKGSRDLARRTIRDVYRASDPISDADFEDARVLVATLGRMMRRKSSEMTPTPGNQSPFPPPAAPPPPRVERDDDRSAGQATSQTVGLTEIAVAAAAAAAATAAATAAADARPITVFEEDLEQPLSSDHPPAFHRSDAPRPVSLTELDPRQGQPVVVARPMAPRAASRSIPRRAVPPPGHPSSRPPNHPYHRSDGPRPISVTEMDPRQHPHHVTARPLAPLSTFFYARGVAESDFTPYSTVPADPRRTTSTRTDTSIMTTPESFRVQRKPVAGSGAVVSPRRSGATSEVTSSNPSRTALASSAARLPPTPPQTGPGSSASLSTIGKRTASPNEAAGSRRTRLVSRR